MDNGFLNWADSAQCLFNCCRPCLRFGNLVKTSVSDISISSSLAFCNSRVRSLTFCSSSILLLSIVKISRYDFIELRDMVYIFRVVRSVFFLVVIDIEIIDHKFFRSFSRLTRSDDKTDVRKSHFPSDKANQIQPSLLRFHYHVDHCC